MFILFALLVAFFGATPLLLAKKINASAIFVVVAFIISWPLLYLAVPSTVWPMFGMIGLFAVISSGVGLIIVILADDNDQILVPAIPFAVVILGFMISGISGCDFANAKEYSNLIGDVEKREWTQDIQPKDPKHIRLVPVENAIFVANKQLGGAEQGAIGSQFEIDSHNVTLQLINEDLWYILPLDFSGYSTWSSTGSAPGYIMVHAEDPNRPPILKLKEKFVYTPNAFFGENLIRHVWSNGYRNKGLTDVNMEIDENGKAWWIINIYEPTISFWGEKTIGIVLVDPTDGKIEFREVGNIPSWVDRAIPKAL